MTTPLMSLIEKLFPNKDKHQELLQRQSLGIFNALVALGNPENGKPLLNVAKTVLDGSKNGLSVTVLHITAGTDINPILGEELSDESFKSVRIEAESLGIPIETEYKVTDNVGHEIVTTTNENDYDFLLVGAGSSMNKPYSNKKKSFLPGIFTGMNVSSSVFYPGTLIKDKSRYFIENCRCSVGVFVNRNFNIISKTLVLLDKEEDIFLLRYARRLIRNNSQVTIRIMDHNGLCSSNKEVAQGVLSLLNEFPDSVKMCKSTLKTKSYMGGFKFMLISYQSWNRLAVSKDNELEFIPSTLIINKKRSRFHNPAVNTEEE